MAHTAINNSRDASFLVSCSGRYSLWTMLSPQEVQGAAAEETHGPCHISERQPRKSI